MAVMTLNVPREHLAWVREVSKGKLEADFDAFPGLNEDLNPTNLKTNRMHLENASRLLEAIGFDGELQRDVSVELASEYILPLLRALLCRLGEDMLVATGEYEGTSLIREEVVRTSQRALWAVQALDELAPGWPESPVFHGSGQGAEAVSA